MLEVYGAQPSTLEDDHPQHMWDEETNSRRRINTPLNHLGNTLGNLRLDLVETLKENISSTYPIPLNWITGVAGKTAHSPK